ncbi:MAG: pyridoxamine 5-phosphate oxidase [Shimia sp.]
MKKDPFHPFDNDALAISLELLSGAAHGAIATQSSAEAPPFVTRIALAVLNGAPHTLVSTLSTHTAPLLEGRIASILVGEPGPKGDPLTHPRLTLQVLPEPADKTGLKEAWLECRPKSALYFDFTDFALIRLSPQEGLLNAGFGRAYKIDDAALARIHHGLSTRATN